MGSTQDEGLNYWRQNTSNAKIESAGNLEWIEGEKVLTYAGDILNLPEAKCDNVSNGKRNS